MIGHTNTVKNKGNRVLGNLRRFKNLIPKIKTILVKTLLIPVLEYLPIPLCSISKSQKINLQTVLNKSLKFINSNETERLTVEELHKKINILPLNLSINYKAAQIWENIHIIQQELYNTLITPHQNTHT